MTIFLICLCLGLILGHIAAMVLMAAFSDEITAWFERSINRVRHIFGCKPI